MGRRVLRRAAGRTTRRGARRTLRKGTPLSHRRRLRGRLTTLGSGLVHATTRFSGFGGHATGRHRRLVSFNIYATIRGLLTIGSGLRETVPAVRKTRTIAVSSKIGVVSGRFDSILSRVKIRPVPSINRRFSPRGRGTIVRSRGRRFKGGAVDRRFVGNCACGSEMVHRSVIGISG